MTTEQGLALYAALSPEDQARADSLALLVRNHESTISVSMPQDLTVGNAWSQYLAALREGGGQLSSTAASWMRDIDGVVGNDIRGAMRNVPGSTELTGFWQALETGGNVAAGATDVITFGPIRRAFDAAITSGRELAGLAGQPVSEERARAFSAAYIAANIEANRAETTAEPDVGRRATGIFDQIGAWFSAGITWINHACPFIPQLFEAIGQFIGGHGWNWEQAGTTVTERLEAEKRELGGDVSFGALSEHYLQSNTRRSTDNRTRRPAGDIMLAAGNIAELPTAPITNLITNGGLYQRQDGTRALLRWNNGALEEQVLTNPETGAPITRGDRTADAWTRILPGAENGNPTVAGLIGGGLGVAGAHQIAQRWFKVERPFVSAASAVGTTLRGATVGSFVGNSGSFRPSEIFSEGGRIGGSNAGVAARAAGEIAGDVATGGGGLLARGGRLLGGLASGASKLARGLPLVGGIMTQGEYWLWGGTTTADGQSMRYWDALDHDLSTGAITQEQHDFYRGLQLGDMGTSFGGVITLGVTETARATMLNGEMARRYLPPSLLQTVGSMVGLSDGGRVQSPDDSAETRARAAAANAVGSNRNIVLSGSEGPNGSMPTVTGGAGPRMVLAAV